MPSPPTSLSALAVEIRPGDPRWPPPLGDLPDPPSLLRVAGVLPGWERAVAIVGTRRADDEGLEMAATLAETLAAHGCVIVSGGARGIDAAAHRGALRGGGATVAVLGSGLRDPYPRRHASLFADVARRGAVVTEVDDGAPMFRSRFLERNRIVAALARVTVVVQAPVRSGALSTAAHARALERGVAAVPAAPWDPRGAGCLELLERGARVCRDARSVLRLLEPGAEKFHESGRPEATLPTPGPSPGTDERAVWDVLAARPRHVDELARRTHLPAARVQTALVALMLEGLAMERGPGRYARGSR